MHGHTEDPTHKQIIGQEAISEHARSASLEWTYQVLAYDRNEQSHRKFTIPCIRSADISRSKARNAK
jgi:hypothetical protein